MSEWQLRTQADSEKNRTAERDFVRENESDGSSFFRPSSSVVWCLARSVLPIEAYLPSACVAAPNR